MEGKSWIFNHNIADQLFKTIKMVDTLGTKNSNSWQQYRKRAYWTKFDVIDFF